MYLNLNKRKQRTTVNRTRGFHQYPLSAIGNSGAIYLELVFMMHVSYDVFGAVTPGVFSVRTNPAMFSNKDKHPILSRGMGNAIAKKIGDVR